MSISVRTRTLVRYRVLSLLADKTTSKFSEWLGVSSLTDSKISQEVIEVLGYLAYEMVREVSLNLSRTGTRIV